MLLRLCFCSINAMHVNNFLLWEKKRTCMQLKSLNSVLVFLSKVDVIKNNCKLVLGVRRHESLILIS